MTSEIWPNLGLNVKSLDIERVESDMELRKGIIG